MVWAKVSDTFYDDPVLLALPRDDRLFFVEATTWACKHETDGVFPKAAVSRFTDTPDVAATVARMLAAGLLIETETTYELVNFLSEQRSKERITEDRVQAAFRKERSRLHAKGDHSTCTRSTFCPAGELEPSRRDGHRDGRRTSQPPDLTRPVPTSREGEGKGQGGADAPAPLRSQALPRPRLVEQ